MVAKTVPPRGSVFGRLGFRLMAAVGLALLPLTLLSYVQSNRFQIEAMARSEAALVGETLLAAKSQVQVIEQARAAAAALAVVIPTLMRDTSSCSLVMEQLVARDPSLSFAGVIFPDGSMVCSSAGRPVELGVTPARQALLDDPKPSMHVNLKGPISGESILEFSHPVFGERGRLLGFITLSVPHRELARELALTRTVRLEGDPVPAALVTFDATGQVLSALNGIGTSTADLPRDRPLASFVGQKPETFRGVTNAGDLRTFAVVPIVPGVLYVLSAWSAATYLDAALGQPVPLWVFPTLMWLASLVVAWLASEHQVLRHVRSLRRSIIAFARGSRIVQLPQFGHAPSELRDVGDAFDILMESVMRDEAELEDTIHQKEVLLREVHHRVKNNLQLIASIMNIQMRKAATGEAKSLVKSLHDRVMSLATVHRELYQTSGLTDVKSDELLAQIVEQVLRMGTVPGRPIAVTTEFDPIRLTPDQAVPLSLIVTESLTNVLKHAGVDETTGKTTLRVSLRRHGEGRAMLTVANTARRDGDVSMSPEADSTGLGEQLLAAFATQLNGDLKVDRDQEIYAVTLDFPIRALSEAEARFAVADELLAAG